MKPTLLELKYTAYRLDQAKELFDRLDEVINDKKSVARWTLNYEKLTRSEHYDGSAFGLFYMLKDHLERMREQFHGKIVLAERDAK